MTLSPEAFASAVVIYRFLMLFPAAVSLFLLSVWLFRRASRLESIDPDKAFFFAVFGSICRVVALIPAPVVMACMFPLAVRATLKLLGVMS